MLATSPLSIIPDGMFPILLCWLLGACTIVGLALFNRSRIRRHDAPV